MNELPNIWSFLETVARLAFWVWVVWCVCKEDL